MSTRDASRPILPTLQVLRGWAAVLVILVHADTAYRRQLGSRFFGGWFAFGGAGVDFFFVLSGFVMYYIHAKDIARPERLAAFARKRLLRIYPAYWVALLSRCVLMLTSYSIADASGALNLFKALLLWPVPHPIVSVSWTLSHEVFFYAIFSLLVALPRRASFPLLALWLVATAGFHVIPGLRAEDDLLHFVLDLHNFEFAAGIAAAALTMRGVSRGWIPLIVGASAFAVSASVVAHGMTGVNGLFLFGLPSALIVWGAAALDRHDALVWPPLATWIGNASYSIYLIHATFVFNMVRMARRPALRGVFESPAGMIGLVLSAIACGCVFYVAIERPLLAVLARPISRDQRRAAARLDLNSSPQRYKEHKGTRIIKF